MISFTCDYIEGAHPEILKRLVETNMIQVEGYGEDHFCNSARAKIKEATGSWPKRTGDMNARNWIYRLPENGYGTRTSSPNGAKCVGVSTGGKYGHVVWSDGTLRISEYNYYSNVTFSERNVNACNYQWFII